MERRRVARKDVSLETEFVSGGKNYTGVIGNISEDGAYIKTNITETAIDFLPATIIELKFSVSSEKTINLLCEIIWLYSKKIQHPRLEGHALENNIGIEIKNSPPEYEKFVMNL
jgi:hypothetical protein